MLVSSSLEMDIAHGLYYGRMKRWEKLRSAPRPSQSSNHLAGVWYSVKALLERRILAGLAEQLLDKLNAVKS
jgi:hypothetical protein